ncbi:MAG TPA: glycosyltransferase [Gaiellaceae bacterium]|nr:glycosyltransferase [Gaiellaceae bacterium]
MPPRILILTASVGAGHDLPARTLADQLRAEQPDLEIVTEDSLPAMGRVVSAVSEDAPRVVFFRFHWIWDLGFWLFARFGPTRRLTQSLLTRFAAPGLLRLIAANDPDVIVSVYPHVTEVLGRLRLARRLDVPIVAAITDLAAMRYWATPGADLHLVTHVESIEEVREVAGRDASVHAVHGFTAPEFLEPRTSEAARRALGVDVKGKLVVVSGGGWGVGDIAGAIEEALLHDEVAQVVCLCGHNEELRLRLLELHGGDPRVRVEGFTKHMPDWLAAGDVLVHSTGGLTVLEAMMRGCPAISYGWGRGHVRLNNAAFQRFGLAEVAGNRKELRTSLARALEQGRTPTAGFAALPSAASFVLAVVSAVG